MIGTHLLAPGGVRKCVYQSASLLVFDRGAKVVQKSPPHQPQGRIAIGIGSQPGIRYREGVATASAYQSVGGESGTMDSSKGLLRQNTAGCPMVVVPGTALTD